MGVAVDLSKITVRFGPLLALDQVDLQVQEGHIHAIVGENGAGKTTLMRVLYGALQPASGEVRVDGRLVEYRSSAEAIADGIGMISQHYSVIPELNNLQNLALGAEPGVWIDEAAAIRRAKELAAQMGFSFDWKAPSSELGPAGAQKLEILKLLWRNSNILILDEPTAMLSPEDADKLFANLRELVEGGATVLLVTHRIREVMQYCDRVSILRGGRNVIDLDVAEADANGLASAIVGHDFVEEEFEPIDPSPNILIVEDLSVLDDRKHKVIDGVSFAVMEEEILGIAGVDGNGQRELFEALFGVRQVVSGRVALQGKPIEALPPSERIAAGIRLLPEDRQHQGLIESWPIEENALLGLHRLLPRTLLGPDRKRSEQLAKQIVERFGTSFTSVRQPISDLSGGNQQRVVAARALAMDPNLILAFQPTRGLDIDAARNVYSQIRQFCRDNTAAAVVIAFDLDELIDNCDRILVLHKGRLSAPPNGLEKSRDEIGKLMVGAH